MQLIFNDFYLTLYPNFHKVVKRDNNVKLLAGPVFLKNDSGQGQLVARFTILEFRENNARHRCISHHWTTELHILHARSR